MDNIKLKQYIRSTKALNYNSILINLKPVNSFSNKQMNIGSMPYTNVKYCIRLLNKIDTWDTVAHLFEICFDVDAETFWNSAVVEFYQAKRFVLHEFQRIIDQENKAMASQSTDEHLWMMAGADRLKPYNDTLPLIQLGKQLGQYPFDLGRKPYNEIFNMLAQIKVQNEVEREFHKLSIKK